MVDPKFEHQPPESLPPVVKTLLIVNVLMFFISAKFPVIFNTLTLWPLSMAPGHGLSFQPWQLVTYGFLHGSPTHLLFNMFALFIFGVQLERLWGSPHFTVFYFVCIIGAGIVQLGVGTPAIGASGGVFGLLLGYGMMYPNNKLMLIFFPVPIAAKYFVVIYGAAELWFGISSPNSKIGHFAHLGGMFFGLIVILYWRGKLPWKPRRQLTR